MHVYKNSRIGVDSSAAPVHSIKRTDVDASALHVHKSRRIGVEASAVPAHNGKRTGCHIRFVSTVVHVRSHTIRLR